MKLSNRDFHRLALPLAILLLRCGIAQHRAWSEYSVDTMILQYFGIFFRNNSAYHHQYILKIAGF